jgi:hypothetical protein
VFEKSSFENHYENNRNYHKGLLQQKNRPKEVQWWPWKRNKESSIQVLRPLWAALDIRNRRPWRQRPCKGRYSVLRNQAIILAFEMIEIASQ